MNGERYYRFLNNLANPLRIKIIMSLKGGEKSVGDISGELKEEQSKVSHALLSMKCCNIVKVRQDGKRRIYTLNDDTIIPILGIIDKHAMVHCNSKTCSCE